MREPIRGGLDPAPPPASRATLLEVASALAGKPSFWGLALGAAASSMMGYGLLFWMPSFLVRSFSLSIVQASMSYGGLVLLGGLAGIWLGGWLADRHGTRHRGAYALVPAIAFLATLPFYVAGVLSATLWVCLAVLLVPTALGLVWLGPVLTAVQQLVPATMRAAASAIFLFINNLLGIGLGTILIGALSDALRVRAGAESLRYSILAGTSFYLAAAVLFLFAAGRLSKDWNSAAFEAL